MEQDRFSRILSALAQRGPLDLSTYPERVCAVAVGLLGMTGAGLILMTNGQAGAVWASDEAVNKIEEAQLTLGEGPGVDAFVLGSPVLEPDLARFSPRWLFFRRAALALGVRALFSLPLQVGVIRIGVLNLYRLEPGFLSDDELADALILADVATQDLLDLQAMGNMPWTGADGVGQRAKVHQATGMVAAQLSSTMGDALARLRAHAFSTGANIFDVAEDVVSRRLRFE